MDVLNHASENKNKSVGAKDGLATCRTQRSDGNKARTRSGGEDPGRKGLVYVLVCEEEDHRVLGISEMAESRRRKKMLERQRRVVAHRERQKTCVL